MMVGGDFMKKGIIIIMLSAVVVVAVALGTYNWLDNGSEKVSATSDTKEKEQAEEVLQENRKDIKGNISDADLAAFKEENLNPFGESTKMEELTDYAYQEYIHGMSHQKVKASKKWGFYEIHPSRIQWLLDGLDKVELDHENAYRNILEKWNNGDFSSVDDDHNAIWSLQNGTVGKATGILSAEAEQAYVNSNGN